MDIINNDTFNNFGMKPLNNFMNGNIANNYTVQEQQGFPIQGSVGSILNIEKNENLNNVNNGLIINPLLSTIDKNNGDIIEINKLKEDNNTFINTKINQPSTPILYCNENQKSELLPNYPNGIENNNISSNCKTLTINNVGSPLLYGVSTFGINDPSLLTNPNNNIGHEIETYGNSNKFGSRVIGQGKNARKSLLPGYNVPTLETQKTDNNSFISIPTSFNEDIPLYQVGNWTNISDNYLKNFNNTNFCN